MTDANVTEMKALLSDLDKQRAELDKQITDALSHKRDGVISEIKSLMAEYDIKQSDLGASRPAARRAGAGVKLPAKYRDQNGNSWSGRGVTPIWMRKALEAGASIDDFRVPADSALLV